MRLHSELPATRVWAYNGSFPGPTIEVRRGERLRVIWQNEITRRLPGHRRRGAQQDAGARARRCSTAAGRRGVAVRTVVHLYGARTGGGNDGWPRTRSCRATPSCRSIRTISGRRRCGTTTTPWRSPA
ncbi:MAG: multicopper oxidase domain-containing protein [Pseudonocardiaceae bacterium]